MALARRTECSGDPPRNPASEYRTADDAEDEKYRLRDTRVAPTTINSDASS